MGNPYLTGNYAPVSDEKTLTELEVTGTIPTHLDGRYVRNGPNPIGEIDQDAYHWFLGDGMVHGVRLRDGRAEWYRNRWVRSEAVAAALGEPPRPRARSAAIPGFAANTNVTAHAGRTLALVEAGPAPYELTDELDTVGPCDFDGTVRGGYAAHPKHDPVTGEMHAVNYHFGRGNTVQYSVIGLDGRARRTVDVEVTGSPMMHDFALTERHVVFLDLPVVFDPAKGAATAGIPAPLRRSVELVLSGLIGRVRVPDPITSRVIGARGGANGDMPYSWDDHYPARIGVMPRDGGSAEVRWFDVDPMYVFHTVGAYDDGDTVVVDAVRHHRMFAADPHGPSGEHPRLHRWRLDLRTGRVSETVLDDREQEFPRADERLVGRRHRYAYTVSAADRIGDPIGDAVLRHDLDAGTTTRRRLGTHVQAGEFVFVPSGADAAEHDGVLMGFVYDADRDRSRLTLLDAASLDTVAEVLLPARVPHGFHGNWLPT
ncbi:carotenoid cleavage dioxygenase [Amycolatopsis arida]|uniref:Dioxygenase n=1 Tax=Amycolatopsis arida TaxID=587909 RepID=A0A1I6ANC2_9PSEU|nr:carotenoid oxygenase family protein [Amycolatopsis arida]TDX87433.1 carotenoid cleavage dioxygenase [Amycolatopsis arida]SFQ70175.1 carotenoid cleavage dioxygenase [Amycolatopsis arida]